MIKKKFKVEGMHCTSCALLIESDLEDEGVVSMCSYVNHTLDVEFDEKKIDEEKIKKVVAKSGYKIAS